MQKVLPDWMLDREVPDTPRTPWILPGALFVLGLFYVTESIVPLTDLQVRFQRLQQQYRNRGDRSVVWAPSKYVDANPSFGSGQKKNH